MLSQILSMIALAVCVTLTTAWRQQASSQKTSPAELLSKLGSDAVKAIAQIQKRMQAHK
jgi:hypothetical protein